MRNDGDGATPSSDAFPEATQNETALADEYGRYRKANAPSPLITARPNMAAENFRIVQHSGITDGKATMTIHLVQN